MENKDNRLEYYRQAIAREPMNSDFYNSLGSYLREIRDFSGAIKAYEKAVEISPNSGNAHHNLPYFLLLTGKLVEGFAKSEQRWEKFGYQKGNFPKQLWNGEYFYDKTILIWADEDFGDAIQFIRFMPFVFEYGKQVKLHCHQELASLFASTFRNLKSISVWGQSVYGYDLHAPLCRLPYLFRTSLETIPNQVPYLNFNRSNLRLHNPDSRKKIGICWASGIHENRDNSEFLLKLQKRRSCPLEIIVKNFNLPGVKLYSLQVGRNSLDISRYGYTNLVEDLSYLIKNFSDTAVLISQLDLVITVDTAVAHLAGSLGKETWMLIPFNADWRWLLHIEYSPWYPTMIIFRQEKEGEWQQPVRRVRDRLITEFLP